METVSFLLLAVTERVEGPPLCVAGGSAVVLPAEWSVAGVLVLEVSTSHKAVAAGSSTCNGHFYPWTHHRPLNM